MTTPAPAKDFLGGLQIPYSRLSFPSLNPTKPKTDKPSKDVPNPKAKWVATFIMVPDAPGTQAFLKALQDKAAEFERAFGYPAYEFPKLKVLGEFTNKMHSKRQLPEHVGCYSFTCNTNATWPDGAPATPPQLLAPDKAPLNFGAFYAGCYVRGYMTLRTYQTQVKGVPSGFAVTADLRAIQFIQDGEKLGGGGQTDFTDVFADEPTPPAYAPQQPVYAPQQPAYAPQPQQPVYAPQQPVYAPQPAYNPAVPQQDPRHFSPTYAPPSYAPQPQQPVYAPQPPADEEAFIL